MIELGLDRRAVAESEEIDDLRRIFRMQVAGLVSIIAHLVVAIVVLMMPDPVTRTTATTESVPPGEEPVTITFVQPPPAPAPLAPSIPARPSSPPPAADPRALYRMDADKLQPSREAETKKEPDTSRTDRGRQDTRAPGGIAGGDLPRPAPGAPGSAGEIEDRNGASVRPPPQTDLAGRLREFEKALRQAAPAPGETGPRGGGQGSGGVDLSNVPMTGFGFGNLEFESRDYDWSNYARAIYWAIWRAWHNRMYVSVGNFERWAAERRSWALDDNNRIRFTITSTGKIVDVLIESPSGCRPLDDSAADALREAVLPPLPADFPRSDETVHARFIADVDIRGMRSGLGRLKERGFF